MERQTVTLKSGIALSYYEFGAHNPEPLIIAQFYFHSFKPLCEALAKRYHVYAVVMRTSGEGTEIAEDGLVDWAHEWSREIYDFATEMGIGPFHFAGKCHGSIPGWGLVEHHPDMLKSFVMLSMVPFSRSGPPPQAFLDLMMLQRRDITQFVKQTVRKPENVQKKLDEINSVNFSEFSGAPPPHMMPLEGLKTNEELFDFYRRMTVPCLLVYGMDDQGFDDAMVLKTARTIPGMKVVTYQGERHLYEMDIPEKIADDVLFFLDGVNGKDAEPVHAQEAVA